MAVATAGRPPRPPQLGTGTEEGGGTKWWHVPDDRIEELVKSLSAPTSPAVAEAPPGPKTAKNRRRRRSEQRISFPSDALDQMLHNLSTESEDKHPGRWRVSDQQLRAFVTNLQEVAKADVASATASASASRRTTDEQAVVANKWRTLKATRSEPPAARSSGRRRSSESDGLITVYVSVMDSCERFTLALPPDLHIGPDKPPPQNRFQDVFGWGASTGGFDQKVRSFDYKYRRWGEPELPGWDPAWTDSLRRRLELATGIEVEQQRLMYNGALISPAADGETLTTFGITPAHFLHLFRRREPHQCNRNLLLACTAKQKEQEALYATLEASSGIVDGGKSVGISAAQMPKPVWDTRTHGRPSRLQRNRSVPG